MVYKMVIPTGGSDEPPACYLPVAQSWKHVLVGLLERPLSDWFWEGTDDEIEAANAEVAKWIDYLEECESMFAIVQGFTFFDCYIHATGGMAYGANALQIHGGFWVNTSASVNESVLEITPLLRAGTYNATLFGAKSSNLGKFRWRIDGEYNDAAHDMDMYNATPLYCVEVTKPVVIVGDGLHEMRLDNVGKNASSSAYYLVFSGLRLVRTGN
jgi:hypothetical protein